MKLVLLNLFMGFFSCSCFSLTITKTAGTVAGVSVTNGISWTNLTATTAIDANRATTTANLTDATSITNKLHFTNFSFNLPSTATIEGVTVNIRRSNAQSNKLLDLVAYLVIYGTELGPNKASAIEWSSTPTDISYGGSTDLWNFGSGLDYSTVNATDFGFAIQVQRTTSTGTPNQKPQIDYMEMTITYNTALPIDLLSFQAKLNHEGERLISWQTASEFNTQDFEIQRAGADHIFSTFSTIKAAGFSNSLKNYFQTDREITDEKILYYRLKQNDQNGAYTLFDPVSVVLSPPYELRVFPNPTTDFISIGGIEHVDEYRIQLITLQGQILIDHALIKGNTMDLREFGKQSYILKVIHEPSSTFKTEQIIVR